jgi:hypothetical protein
LNACVCVQPKIVHLDFCDVTDIQLPAFQNEKVDSSQQLRSIYFLIDESDPKCIKDSMMTNFIKTDQFIQNEISAKYAGLTINFYRKSKETDFLVKNKSSRDLPYCNKDIVAEFQWTNGIYSLVNHYTNGLIDGIDNTELEDLKHPKEK